MNGISLLLLAAVSVALHAPSEEQTNTYKIVEKDWASDFGSVTMTGTERRHIGKPSKGKRQVDITFEVSISEKGYTGSGAEKWAQDALRDLREPDRGTMDDLDRFAESDGVSVDAFPIFTDKPLEVGGAWQVMVEGTKYLYTFDSVEKANGLDCAVIRTESTMKNRMGTVSRKGMWKVEIGTGRLVAWSLHSNVLYPNGKKETVDSSGNLVVP